jgi:uroporphyrinogen-III decarboxylase
MIGIGKAQVEAAGGALSGLYLWGDVAYTKGMLFSPKLWEKLFYPYVKEMCQEFHQLGMKVIYHGCGDSREIMDMLIDAGIDGYNPLEAKAGLDVVKLKKKYGKRLAWVGNIDVRVLAKGSREDIKREVLRKLNAAKGGGYIFQSDHSVPANVPPENYHYAIQLVKEFGRYPLNLGEFEEEI